MPRRHRHHRHGRCCHQKELKLQGVRPGAPPCSAALPPDAGVPGAPRPRRRGRRAVRVGLPAGSAARVTTTLLWSGGAALAPVGLASAGSLPFLTWACRGPDSPGDPGSKKQTAKECRG